MNRSTTGGRLFCSRFFPEQHCHQYLVQIPPCIGRLTPLENFPTSEITVWKCVHTFHLSRTCWFSRKAVIAHFFLCLGDCLSSFPIFRAAALSYFRQPDTASFPAVSNRWRRAACSLDLLFYELHAHPLPVFQLVRTRAHRCTPPTKHPLPTRKYGVFFL